MAQKIFVSHNFSDRVVNAMVKFMMQKPQKDITGQLVFVENDVSYNGPSAVAWEVARIMDDCDAVLVIIGENPHNSPWLDAEVEVASSKDMPILLTQLPNTNGMIPACLANINTVKVGWDANEITACLIKY